MPHRRQYDILIYASNLTGLGSTQVAGSLVEALINSIGQQEIALIVPSRPTWTQNITPRPNLTTIHYRRRLPHRISRLCEVLHGSDDSIEAEKIINLGDLPLKTNVQQLVLVHQSHLISPKVDPYSSKALAFRTMRCLMHCNSKYADRIVVQTDVLKRHLSQSYPSLAARIVVIPQPVPSWLPIEIRGTKEQRFEGERLTLFYPAAGYPHKNHDLILELTDHPRFRNRVKKIITTRSTSSWIKQSAKSWIDNRGRLSPLEMVAAYNESDALFFPSKSESYGLPILEAMTLGLPVICSDRPFSRWICDSNADFFDPERVESALAAIRSAHLKLKSNHWPDWKRALSKFPASWDRVAQKFLRCLRSC